MPFLIIIPVTVIFLVFLIPNIIYTSTEWHNCSNAWQKYCFAVWAHLLLIFLCILGWMITSGILSWYNPVDEIVYKVHKIENISLIIDDNDIIDVTKELGTVGDNVVKRRIYKRTCLGIDWLNTRGPLIIEREE